MILIRIPLIASSMMTRHSSLRQRERTSGGLTCDLYVDLILPDASAAAAAVVAGHAVPRARSDAMGCAAEDAASRSQEARRGRERGREAQAQAQAVSDSAWERRTGEGWKNGVALDEGTATTAW